MQGVDYGSNGFALTFVLVHGAVTASADGMGVAKVVEFHRSPVPGQLDVLLRKFRGRHTQIIDRRGRAVRIVKRRADRVVRMSVSERGCLDGLHQVAREEVAEIHEMADLADDPFLDRLSQRVEAIASGLVFESEPSGGSAISGAVKSFAAELWRVVFLAAVWLVLSVVGFVIPGAQLVTVPMLIATTILFLPLDYAGYALDRRGVSFRARRDWLLGNLSLMLGFGGVAFVACLVPGLNLLLMPAQVTAGTLLVARRAP